MTYERVKDLRVRSLKRFFQSNLCAHERSCSKAFQTMALVESTTFNDSKPLKSDTKSRSTYLAYKGIRGTKSCIPNFPRPKRSRENRACLSSNSVSMYFLLFSPPFDIMFVNLTQNLRNSISN